MTKILVCSNIFGNTLYLRQIIDSIYSENIDGIFICGNIAPLNIWPVAPDVTDDDILYFQNRGIFPYPIGEDEFNKFQEIINMAKYDSESVEFLDRIFNRISNDMKKIDSFKLDTTNKVISFLRDVSEEKEIPCYLIPGRYDIKKLEYIIESHHSPYISFVHKKLFDFNGYLCAGIGGYVENEVEYLVNRFSYLFWEQHKKYHSFYVQRALWRHYHRHKENYFEYDDSDIKNIFKLIKQGIGKYKKKIEIFFTHMAPAGSGADITAKDSNRLVFSGSKVLREKVEELRPFLVLCGYPPESAGITTVESTTIVNSGHLSGINRPFINPRELYDEIALTYTPGELFRYAGGIAVIVNINADKKISGEELVVRELVGNIEH